MKKTIKSNSLIMLALIVFSMNLLFANTATGATAITIQLKYITFSNATKFTPPEIDPTTINANFSEYFYYKLDGYNSNDVDITLNVNYTGTVMLYISAEKGSGTGDALGEICTYYKVENIVSGNDFDVELVLDNAIPDFIDRKNFTWNWAITVIPLCPSTYCANTRTLTTSHNAYIIYETPIIYETAFEEEEENPFSNALNLACDLAFEQDDDIDIMKSIVEGIYDNSGFYYDSEDAEATYIHNGDFRLTKFIVEFYSGNSVNCYDMGVAVTVLSNVLGIDSDMMKSDPFGYVNCIKPIGSDEWTNNPMYESGDCSSEEIVPEDNDENDDEERSKFSTHAFCEYDNSIFDACLIVDTDNNPDSDLDDFGIYEGHDETWANNWS